MLRILAIALTAISIFSSSARADEALNFNNKKFACSGATPTTLHAPVTPRGTPEWEFRSRIAAETAKTGVNFCKKFTQVSIGFTGPAQVNFIVDRVNGAVFQLPTSDVGIDVKKGSSLFIINPNPADYVEFAPGTTGLPTRQFYNWNVEQKRFELIREEVVEITATSLAP